MFFRMLNTPIGTLSLIGPNPALSQIRFANQAMPSELRDKVEEAPQGFAQAVEQIQAYFAGENPRWDCPLQPQVSAFQWRVMQALQGIPSGQTLSYAQLASGLNPRSAPRAVGGACARNPLPLIMPCHRVVGSQGQLTGFAGGMPAKAWLLAFERGEKPPALV